MLPPTPNQVCGVDVYHPPPGSPQPSWVALVASATLTLTLTLTQTLPQTLTSTPNPDPNPNPNRATYSAAGRLPGRALQQVAHHRRRTLQKTKPNPETPKT